MVEVLNSSFRVFTAKLLDVQILRGFYCSMYEPRSEKTGIRGFRPGPTQTGLCSH